MDIMSRAVNAKHVYRDPHNTSDEILAEFASDKDLSFATLRTMYYKTWKINGIRREGSWQSKRLLKGRHNQIQTQKEFRKDKEKEKGKEKIESAGNEQQNPQTSFVTKILQGAESMFDKVEKYNRPFRISDKAKSLANTRPLIDRKKGANKENEQRKDDKRHGRPYLATGSNAIPLGDRNVNTNGKALKSTTNESDNGNAKHSIMDVDYDEEHVPLAQAGDHC